MGQKMVALMGQKMVAYRSFVRKPKGTGAVGRPRSRWDESTKLVLNKLG
jgi:hypothetical protein